MKHSAVLKFDASLEDFFNVKAAIPGNALNFQMKPVSEWRGYGSNERKETVGVEYSWETE